MNPLDPRVYIQSNIITPRDLMRWAINMFMPMELFKNGETIDSFNKIMEEKYINLEKVYMKVK